MASVTITKNAFRAAPTFVTQEHTADGQAQAIVCNSGNANAATGQQGMDNAPKMAVLAAEQLRRFQRLVTRVPAAPPVVNYALKLVWQT